MATSKVSSCSVSVGSYAFFTNRPANSWYFSVSTDDCTKASSKSSNKKNFPVMSTIGRVSPFFVNIINPGTPAFLATKASSAPNVGAMCTIPVPSSVVTKSPAITRNAPLPGFTHGMSCSYSKPTKSLPEHSPMISKVAIFFSPK